MNLEILLSWLRDLTPDALTCPAELVATVQAELAAAELGEDEAWMRGVEVAANEDGDPWIRLYREGALVHCGSCGEWGAGG